MEYTPPTEHSGNPDLTSTGAGGEQPFSSAAAGGGGEATPFSVSGSSALDHRPATAGEVVSTTPEASAAEAATPATDIVSGTLDVAHAAAFRNVELMDKVTALRVRAAELNKQADRAASQASLEYSIMTGTMISGRESLWRVSRNDQGYATGEAAFADAIRLSPPHDSLPEPRDVREARVQALQTLGSNIVAGEVTVLSQRYPRDMTGECHVAIPDHDGFSFRFDRQSQDFMLGVGNQTAIPIRNASERVVPAGSETEENPVQFVPTIDVHRGDAAARFLAETVVGDTIFVQAVGNPFTDPRLNPHERHTAAARRDTSVENVIKVINAAERVGIRIDLGDVHGRTVEVLTSFRQRFANVSPRGYEQYEAAGRALDYLSGQTPTTAREEQDGTRLG